MLLKAADWLLNTFQMRIGLRECFCSWLSEVSLCCLGENQEEEFNLSFFLDFRALQKGSERFGLGAWSSRFWERKQNLVLHWEEKLTCHLQSQDLLFFFRNGEPEEITGYGAAIWENLEQRQKDEKENSPGKTLAENIWVLQRFLPLLLNM